MRRTLPLAILVVVALGAWFLLSDRGGGVATAPEVASDGEARPEAGTRPPPADSTSLRAAPPPKRNVQPRRGPASVEVKQGSLVVRPVTEGDAPVPPTTRVDVEPLGRAPSAHPLPDRDENGVYRYAAIPVGAYRVRVMAEGFEDATAEAEVAEGTESSVDVPLKAGSVVSYAVALPDGSAPESVTIALLDARGQSLAFTAQTSATTLHTTTDRPLALPPKARLIGLRSGKYTLRATSPAGESAESVFVAKVGEEPVVELTVRR